MNGQTGDSLRAAMATYSDMVYRLAYARTRNRADAEDIYQEVFLRFAAHCDSLENPRAWLIRVTANLSISLLRSAWRRRAVTSDMSLLPDRAEPCASPATVRLMDALEKLPSRDRVVIHLYYFEDMKTEEIAAELGMKPATVRSRLSRARKLLRRNLSEGRDGE